VNQKDSVHGDFALKEAASNGHTECCEYLCSEGADVNLGNKNGATSLIIASVKGH
jgi:ankyrin repeat protein